MLPKPRPKPVTQSCQMTPPPSSKLLTVTESVQARKKKRPLGTSGYEDQIFYHDRSININSAINLSGNDSTVIEKALAPENGTSSFITGTKTLIRTTPGNITVSPMPTEKGTNFDSNSLLRSQVQIHSQFEGFGHDNPNPDPYGLDINIIDYSIMLMNLYNLVENTAFPKN